MSQIINNDAIEWSDELKAQTYQAIGNYYCAPDGNLHLKNKIQGFGFIHWKDLIHARILVRNKNENSSTLKFKDISSLIDAGWVID